MLKVLVLGSKGFIGSNLVTYLSSNNVEVHGADLQSDYDATNYFIITSIEVTLGSILKKTSFDYCINCIGSANVGYSFINPHSDFDSNANVVSKILVQLKQCNTACKFIHLSSAAVYGNPKQIPVSEIDCLNPISPYGYNKLISELICKQYYELFKIPICILRPFSVYGSGLKKQVFWDWYVKSRSTNNVGLLGNGMETRDFIHIDDLCFAVYNIMLKSAFNYDIYNVCNGEEVSISSVAALYFNALQINYTFINDSTIGNPINWCGNNKKLASLGYHKSITLQAGLTKLVQWQTNQNL